MRWSTLKIQDLTLNQIETWHRLHGQETTLRSPFTTYEFCRAVDKVRGNVFVSILENRGEIQAIFPFERSYRLIPGIARKPGAHLSDCFGIIGGARHLLNEREILESAGLSVFSFDHLPLQENVLPAWRGTVSHGIRVELPNFSDYVERLRKTNKKRVKEVERRSDQLVERYGAMDFQWQAAAPCSSMPRQGWRIYPISSSGI